MIEEDDDQQVTGSSLRVACLQDFRLLVPLTYTSTRLLCSPQRMLGSHRYPDNHPQHVQIRILYRESSTCSLYEPELIIFGTLGRRGRRGCRGKDVAKGEHLGCSSSSKYINAELSVQIGDPG